MLGIITSYHIYSSRLAVVINQTFAVIKLMILSSIAIAGLVKLPATLKENPNNWTNFEHTELTEEFKDFSASFVLVCNLTYCKYILYFLLLKFNLILILI
jgi:hypothetical protein